MSESKRELTFKQERFCLELAYHGNASTAYRIAYNCGGMNENSIGKEAAILKKQPNIANRIAELKDEYRRRFDADKDKAVRVLSQIIGFDISDLYVYNSETGESRIRKPDELPSATKVVIQQIEESKDSIKYKLYSKIDAIKQLSVLLDWKPEVKIDIGSKEKNVLRIGFKD